MSNVGVFGAGESGVALGNLIDIKSFTSSQKYDVPSNTDFAIITIVGGGEDGGDATSGTVGAPGGRPGSYVKLRVNRADLPGILDIVVGGVNVASSVTGIASVSTTSYTAATITKGELILDIPRADMRDSQTSGNPVYGGEGGSTPFGYGGGGSRSTGGAANGQDGTGHGSGGGGAARVSSGSGTGGSATAGIVVIEFYARSS